jgi:hypothetical protein
MKNLSLLAGAAVIVVLCGFASTAPAASTVFRCNGHFSGGRYQAVVVPANDVCVLTNSIVSGDVVPQHNAYFEADSAKIRGNVHGRRAQTIFINTGSRVGGDVLADGGAQLFVYNSTVGHSIGASSLTNEVEVCGNKVSSGSVDVEGLHGGGNEILIGDPAANCGANTISRGSLRVEDNFTDVYFAISGNRIRHGNLRVTHNTGTSEKLVQANNGGQTLKCSNNASPFAGHPNGTWASKQGQCSAL